MQVFKQAKTYLNTKTITGKVKHIETDVIYSWTHDDSTPDFDYGNEVENKRELARFESGELLNVLLKVECFALGFSGTEFMGQCFVSAKNMEIELIELANEHDLKGQACISLLSDLKGNYHTLKNLFETDQK